MGILGDKEGEGGANRIKFPLSGKMLPKCASGSHREWDGLEQEGNGKVMGILGDKEGEGGANRIKFLGPSSKNLWVHH